MTTNAISNTTENAILNLIFSATAWTNYAINATSSPETNIAVALSTGTLSDTSDQSTTEATYSPYARVNVARSTGWTTASTGSVNPAANIDFPACTSGTSTATFFSVGKASVGAGAAILWYGDIAPSISVSSGVTPRLTTATSISLD